MNNTSLLTETYSQISQPERVGADILYIEFLPPPGLYQTVYQTELFPNALVLQCMFIDFNSYVLSLGLQYN